MHRNRPYYLVILLVALLTIHQGAPSQKKGLSSRATANFLFRYDRTAGAANVQRIGKEMEKLCEEYSARLGVTLRRKVDVYALGSPEGYKRESKNSIYDEAAVRDGRIYLNVSTLVKVDTSQSAPLARAVSEALLSELKSCPRWLVEVYGIYAGKDASRFGPPAQATASSFSDLTEDYARAESGKEMADVYAKLAATTQFLVQRYGEQKFEQMYRQFNRAQTLDAAFEAAFGEKMSVIEKAWSAALRSPPKG